MHGEGFQKEVNIFRPDIIHAQWGQSVIPTLPKNVHWSLHTEEMMLREL